MSQRSALSRDGVAREKHWLDDPGCISFDGRLHARERSCTFAIEIREVRIMRALFHMRTQKCLNFGIASSQSQARRVHAIDCHHIDESG